MPDFSVWDAISAMGAGNQMSPQVMGQMAAQAEPAPDQSIPPFLRQGGPMAAFGPQNPMVVQPPPQRVPMTAQPTTQPLGTLPQEIQPAQPTMTAPTQPDAMALYGQAIANAKLPDNSKMLAELKLGQQQMDEQTAGYKSELDMLKEGLAKYASTPRGLDLTPGAATIDSLFGSSLSKGIQAPESSAQKMNNMQTMQARIAEAQGKIPGMQLDQLKNKLAQMGYMDERQIKLEIAKLNNQAQIAKHLTPKPGLNQGLAQREQARLDREVQSLEKRIGDVAPGILTKLNNLEKIVPGGIEGDESADVAGVGPAQFLIPDVMINDEASDVQQNARGLAADLIKLQSGTAASEKEVDRKMKELGMAPGSKSSTFRSGLKRLKDQFANELKNKEAGFRPEAREIYKSRGGITHESVMSIGRPQSAPSGFSPEKQKRLEELRMKLGK